MATRRKRSISLPPEIDEAVEAAALEEGTTFSAWVTEAARNRLIVRDGLAAVAEYEAEYGAFTEEELRDADAWVTATLAKSNAPEGSTRRPA